MFGMFGPEPPKSRVDLDGKEWICVLVLTKAPGVTWGLAMEHGAESPAPVSAVAFAPSDAEIDVLKFAARLRAQSEEKDRGLATRRRKARP
ncbi:hypothetical protein LCGC14_2636010 [marine sediment metagenome]|uniref:Uncharacterized protein n=1 Tax=marine sediment metagenome TaxID=412755 RepID=A0A0F8ZZ54_9ZZZZ